MFKDPPTKFTGFRWGEIVCDSLAVLLIILLWVNCVDYFLEWL